MKKLKGVVTVTADDGAQETFGALEVGLDPKKAYTVKAWWKAICKLKDFSPTQKVTID